MATLDVNVTIPDFTGDTGTGGVKGLVPAPAAGDAAANKYLKADGTWATTAGGGDVVGPSSATDNAIARYDTTTGKLIQNSLVKISDTGALGNVDAIAMDLTADTPSGVGVVKWNGVDGTIEVGLLGGNVTLQVGQESVTYCKDADSAGITEANVYYFVGSDGTNKTVRKARADSLSTSATVIGLATESSAGGNKAYITTYGLVRDINTSALTEGAVVYLSSSVAGGMTTTKPTAPNIAVQVGYCVRKHATVGSIFVTILRDQLLGDVAGPASSTLDHIALFADTTGKVIKDAGIDLSEVVTTDGSPAGVSPIGSGAGVSPIELRRFIDGTGTEAQANTGSVQYNLKFTAADKYWYGGTLAAPTEGDITAAGRALLDDATAADQRTTLGLGTNALINGAPSYITYTGGSIATTSTGFADVHSSAGWSGLAPGMYLGEFYINYDAVATTTGARFGLNGTVTQNYLTAFVGYSTQPGDRSSAQTASFDAGATAPSSIVTSGNNAVVQFTVNVTVTGNIVLRFATEVGGSAITVTSVIGFIRRVA